MEVFDVKCKQSNRKIIFLRVTEKPIRKDVQILVRKLQQSLLSFFWLAFFSFSITLYYYFLSAECINRFLYHISFFYIMYRLPFANTYIL